MVSPCFSPEGCNSSANCRRHLLNGLPHPNLPLNTPNRCTVPEQKHMQGPTGCPANCSPSTSSPTASGTPPNGGWSTEQPQAFTAFAGAVAQRFEAFGRYDSPNESVTEQELIRSVLGLLGWVHTLPQQGAAGNEDIPDHLLFADAESKARAAGRSALSDACASGTPWSIEESKRSRPVRWTFPGR